MKVRSQVEIQEILDSDLARRKHELTTMRFLILSCHRDHEKNFLLRAAVPMLYSHWEGFIKLSASAYLYFVSQQGILLKDLNENFIAIACRKEIIAAASSRKVSLHSEIVKFVTNNIDHSVPLCVEGAIDTESNLSSNVLKEIMITIGFEFTDTWQKKSLWVDHQLLKSRNEIAHGELTPIEIDTYEQLHGFVVQSLEEFKTGIENAISQKAYLKKQS